MIFVGESAGSRGQQRDPPSDTGFTPRVIVPDPAVQEARQEFLAAKANLAERYEALIQEAQEVGEMAEVKLWTDLLQALK